MSVNYKLLKNYGKLPKSSEYRAVIVENHKVGLRRSHVAYKCRHSGSGGWLAR